MLTMRVWTVSSPRALARATASTLTFCTALTNAYVLWLLCHGGWTACTTVVTLLADDDLWSLFFAVCVCVLAVRPADHEASKVALVQQTGLSDGCQLVEVTGLVVQVHYWTTMLFAAWSIV